MFERSRPTRRAASACVLVCLTGSLAAWPSAVGAAEPAAESSEVVPGQRNLGVGLTAGVFNGFGALLRLGTPDFGVEATGGWLPVIVATEQVDQQGDEELALDFMSSYQVGAHGYVTVLRPSEKATIGLLGGYKYNGVLGHGGTLGAFFLLELSETFVLHGAGGPVYYPDGEDRVRDELDLPEAADFGFPGPVFQSGVNLSIVAYL